MLGQGVSALYRYFFICVMGLAQAASASETLEFRGNMSWLNALQYTKLEPNSVFNPDNQTARLPAVTLISELRPEFKIISPQAITVLARPRVQMRAEQTTVDEQTSPTRGQSKALLNEAFIQWALSENLSFAYGKQYYSWGATESLTPSNRVFHETALARNALYEVRGKHLARLNFSLGRTASLVLIGNYEAADDEEVFVAEEAYAAQALAKAEINWNSGFDFFGIVLGGSEHGRSWLGEYISWSLPGLDGFSIYADASHERGANVWYPQKKSAIMPGQPQQSIVVMEKSQLTASRIYTLAVAGLRYDFENGITVRGEWIGNELGYSVDQSQTLRQAAAPRPLDQTGLLDPESAKANLRRATARGSELPGRRYAYVSLLWPKVFNNADWQLTARTLYSLNDYSSSSYAAVEYAAGEAGTLFVATSYQAGERDSELHNLSSATHIAGYRHTW